MLIFKHAKKFAINVRISGANRGPDGKRQNTTRTITLYDTTVDEVETIIKAALEKAIEAEDSANGTRIQTRQGSFEAAATERIAS